MDKAESFGMLVILLALALFIIEEVRCLLAPKPPFFWTRHQKKIASQKLLDAKYRLRYRIGGLIFLVFLISAFCFVFRMWVTVLFV